MKMDEDTAASEITTEAIKEYVSSSFTDPKIM